MANFNPPPLPAPTATTAAFREHGDTLHPREWYTTMTGWVREQIDEAYALLAVYDFRPGVEPRTLTGAPQTFSTRGHRGGVRMEVHEIRVEIQLNTPGLMPDYMVRFPLFMYCDKIVTEYYTYSGDDALHNMITGVAHAMPNTGTSAEPTS